MGEMGRRMDFLRCASKESMSSPKASMPEAACRPETAPMSLIETTQPSVAPALPNTLRLAAVHLTIADLDRAVAWYQRSLGLRVHSHEITTAELGDGDETVVVLHEDPHRDREQWPAGLGHDRGPGPLDFNSLLDTVAGEQPSDFVGQGLRMGHLHLHVDDIERALGFYRDVLGFEVQANLGSAAFVSAGGYHRHLGINVWKSKGGGPQPDGVAGLHHVAFLFPSQAGLAQVVKRLLGAGVEPYQALDHGTTWPSTSLAPTATTSSWPGTARRRSGRRTTAPISSTPRWTSTP